MKINSEYGSADVKIDLIHGEPRKLNGKEIVMKSNGSPDLKYKDSKGNELMWLEVDKISGDVIKGKNVGYGGTDGIILPKEQVIPYYQLEDGTLVEAVKNEKTDVFEITSWEPIENYLNKYQMESYHQVRPDCGDSPKDFSKKLNVEVNTVELFKLWKKMSADNVVGRGEFPSASGYLKRYGYLRPITLKGNPLIPDDTHWSFEIAVFKEGKPVTWSESLEWQPTMLNKGGTVKIKGKDTATVVEDI